MASPGAMCPASRNNFWAEGLLTVLPRGTPPRQAPSGSRSPRQVAARYGSSCDFHWPTRNDLPRMKAGSPLIVEGSAAMFYPSRRAFLEASLTGLAAGPTFGAAPPVRKLAKGPDDAPFRPSTLFLTWQRDPTTTMTVQWVGARGETADPTISYATTH